VGVKAAVATKVGYRVADADGVPVAVGHMLGVAVVGAGVELGDGVGAPEGTPVGAGVGDTDHCSLQTSGLLMQSVVGGHVYCVGRIVGKGVGKFVGFGVGIGVGAVG
jgi:hypothetical protein